MHFAVRILLLFLSVSCFVKANDTNSCNTELDSKANGAVYLTMCLVVVICSTGFLCGSIYVYYSVAELLLSQLQEAEKNAHDVMDAILAVLIPESLLNDIAEKKKHK
ncbi:hypothetical protein DdX_07909 [Ditylenchus destructor]|uniref:Uncharacterized protein n=1 Tax=Ditylenchus destructor TaxID=166010 RepID=A0AAD4N927_9BILA|nr:hypothetical protein DdX_07909 [Ditylenchus destructor]